MNHHASFGILLHKGRKGSVSQSEDQEEFNSSDLPPAHQAAADGYIDTLTEVVQKDPSLLEQYSLDGLTPLGQAVLCQQLDAVKRLIKLGANIDAQDNVGRTCLSIAAYQGWHQGVMCLLRNGAKQSICDKSGRYPLHAATYHSDMSTLSLLLNGLTSKEINLADHELMTAVHWAAFHDRPEHLLILVQKGGDILSRDVDGKLPLHWAAQNNSFQCAHRLTSLTEGLATVNDLDFSGKSPAHYAAASGASNILKILSRCEGCNLEIEDPDERTPLHWAAAMGHGKAVETLLNLGVDPFPMDVDGGTPLEYALQAGNKECVKAMEDCIGTPEVKLRTESKENSKIKQMRPEHRYHFRKPKSTEDAQSVEVPDIEVQPPTTVTKSNSNRTVKTVPDMVPRMYSASSTDTDAYDFQPPVTVRDLRYEDEHHSSEDELKNDKAPEKKPSDTRPTHSKERRDSHDKKQESAIASLIGSSFMAGARAPILHPSPKASAFPLENLRIEEDEYVPTSAAPDGTEANKWARSVKVGINSGDKSGRQNSDMKVMTSTNTPDLQRVSVQSFRSIPPIPSNPEGAVSPRGSGRNVRSQPSLDIDSQCSD